MRLQRTVVCSRDMDIERDRQEKLLAFEIKCYRRILKITWRDMINNEVIRKRLPIEKTIIDTILKRKRRLFGHLCRMNDNILVKHVLLSKMDEKGRR